MTKELPVFPNFRRFNLDDTKWYYDYYLLNALNPYADIHPANLFIWLNINNDLMISKFNNSIIFRYTNVLNNNQINIIPIEKNVDDLVIDEIMSFLKIKNLPQEIREIPSIMCENLDSTRWVIKNDRDSYEYILNTSQQSSLEGSDFALHRKRINIFEREHCNDLVDVEYMKTITSTIKEAFLHQIDTMPLNKSIGASQNNLIEPIAIKRNLKYASTFHKQAMVIRINGKIVSLAMFSCLDKNTVAINHLKVDYSVKHIFQYSIYQLAKILKDNEINEMNIEQDLGIDGLRTYKERLRPSRLLEKKIIRPRPQ